MVVGMATRTILIMIGALCLATAEDTGEYIEYFATRSLLHAWLYSTDQYPYSYDIHPRLLVKSFNQSQENGTHLTFCCQVSSEETEFAKYNFSIEWHHIDHNSESMLYSILSSNLKVEDTENTIISSINQTQITPEWNITESRTLEWSKLTIHIQRKKDTGYYWCSVKFNDNGTMFVPSTVLNISSVEDIQLQTCKYDNGPIIVNGSESLFSKFRCASGNVETQSNECQPSDQDEMPPSTSTATVEDLNTTTPSETDTVNGTAPSTDNGSTTGEETAETLTDLPTTQETIVTMEITTDSEKEHDDTTQATYAPDTEGPITAEIPRRDQLDKIMLNFIVGKLSHLLSPLPINFLYLYVHSQL